MANEYIEPTPVVVVQPRHKAWVAWLAIPFSIGFTALYAWFVTMLLPVVFEVSWDFWRCFWLLILARLFIPRGFRFQSNFRKFLHNEKSD
jgi:hypothetical protein